MYKIQSFITAYSNAPFNFWRLGYQLYGRHKLTLQVLRHTNTLEINQVSKAYKGKSSVQALDNIDLRQKVEILLRYLDQVVAVSRHHVTAGGLLAPDSGSALINGQNLYDLNNSKRAEFRAKNLAFVYQKFHLIPT